MWTLGEFSTQRSNSKLNLHLLHKPFLLHLRSPVTHRMAPWVQRLFIQILPKLLCIERPKKEEPEEDQPPEVLTDVYHLPPDVDKFVNYDSKRFSGDYGIPGKRFHAPITPLPLVVLTIEFPFGESRCRESHGELEKVFLYFLALLESNFLCRTLHLGLLMPLVLPRILSRLLLPQLGNLCMFSTGFSGHITDYAWSEQPATYNFQLASLYSILNMHNIEIICIQTRHFIMTLDQGGTNNLWQLTSATARTPAKGKVLTENNKFPEMAFVSLCHRQQPAFRWGIKLSGNFSSYIKIKFRFLAYTLYFVSATKSNFVQKENTWRGLKLLSSWLQNWIISSLKWLSQQHK